MNKLIDIMNDAAKHLNDNTCMCGRGQAEAQYDFHGIYAGKMCDKCFKDKFKQYDYLPEGDDVLDYEY